MGSVVEAEASFYLSALEFWSNQADSLILTERQG